MVFRSPKFWGSFSSDFSHGPGSSRRHCWAVFAPQKQMKFLEQQQDETKQAREEARRLRSKMQTMERCVPAHPAQPPGHSSQDCPGVGHRCGSNLQRLWGLGQLDVGTGLCSASMGSSASPRALATSSLSCCLWPVDLQAFCSEGLPLRIPGLEDLGQHPFLPSSVPEAVRGSAVGLALGTPPAKAS